MSGKPCQPQADQTMDEPGTTHCDTEQSADQVRQGRRYQVSNQRGKASGKVRYVEGNMPKGGCRFLS